MRKGHPMDSNVKPRIPVNSEYEGEILGGGRHWLPKSWLEDNNWGVYSK